MRRAPGPPLSRARTWHPAIACHVGCVRLLVPILLLLAAHGRAATPVQPMPPVIRVEEIASPAGAGASGASLTTSPDGTVWLSWLEPVTSPAGQTAAPGPMALRVSTLDPATNIWRAPRTIASGTNWFVNWADFPALTVGPGGHATAVWFVNNPATAAAHDHDGPGYRAFLSRTTDAGATWSAPLALTKSSDSVEFVSLATLADGRVLAAWLDGRGKKAGGRTQRLYARIVGDQGPDTLIDESVCDCCQTALTAFPDGGALLAYRGRTREEVRDIRLARFRGTAWETPHALASDDWRIDGCPVNGPQLASDGGRVAAAWFTGADNDPRVLASFSPDAGARFLMPLRIDSAKPAGRVATLLLHDGALLVTWVGADGGFWLRRVTPDFTITEPVALTTPAAGTVKGFPRLALRRDYAGGKTTAQFIAAYTREGSPSTVATLLVTVPEGELLEAEKNCDCAPTAEQLQGYSIRGTITDVRPAAGALRVSHFELPGIFPAGTRDFKVSAELLAAVQPGRQFLGRVDRRDGVWWLFDVRLLAAPPLPAK